ncbi:MAG: hypothetical protein WAK21_01045 [Candidatus Sulfotelmatobacter sp.]|jgi:hypothetical protein
MISRDVAASLYVEEARKLADELATLAKQQSEALERAVYLGMSADEAKLYDQHRARITEIAKLLGSYFPV